MHELVYNIKTVIKKTESEYSDWIILAQDTTEKWHTFTRAAPLLEEFSPYSHISFLTPILILLAHLHVGL
jgi:hypothetical protein